MRRTALVLVLLVAALGVVAAGCGGEEEQIRDARDRRGPGHADRRRRRPRRRPTDDRDHGDDRDRHETTDDRDDARSPKAIRSPARRSSSAPSACGGCHTLADAGSTGNVGPNLDDAKPSYDLVVDRVTNGQGGMPSFRARSPSSRSPTSPRTSRRSPASSARAF